MGAPRLLNIDCDKESGLYSDEEPQMSRGGGRGTDEGMNLNDKGEKCG